MQSNSVGQFNATTGALLNASFITGLNFPFGILSTETDFYVANTSDNTVGKYSAITGTAVNASFITGLSNPTTLAMNVPEPGTAGLLLLGGLALLRRRRVG